MDFEYSLNKSGESGNPGLFPYLRGKAFSFSLSSIDVSYGFFLYDLYFVEVCSLSTHFVERFLKSKLDIEVFSNAFLHLLRWSYGFYSPFGWCGCIMLLYLKMLTHPCITGINSIGTWCMILLLYCWIQFADILLRIFALIFIKDIRP